MKPYINLKGISILVLASLWIADQGFTQISWQQQYGCGDGLSCSPGAITFDNINNKLLIIGTTFIPDDYSQGKFWLWKIEPSNGERTTNAVIKDAPQDLGVSIQSGSLAIKGLEVSGGHIFAAGEFDSSFTLSFIKMDGTGQIIFSKTVEGNPNEEEIVMRMMYIPDDNFLFVGRSGQNNGLIIKTDAEGNKLWMKTYDFGTGQVKFFTDIEVTGSLGDFVVTGCSTNVQGLSPIEPSNACMLRCDAAGNIVTTKLFSASAYSRKWPELCQLDSGNFIVIYNKSTQRDTMDYNIKAFDSVLEPLWEKQVFTSVNSDAGSFGIKAVPSTGGGFVVAGCKDYTNLMVYEYDEGGNQLSSLSLDNVVWAGNLHIICAQGKAFIVSEMHAGNGDIGEVKIIALQLNQ